MVARSPALDLIRDGLMASASAFLRNVRWTAGATCWVCAGIPSNSSYSTCYQCDGRSHSPERADRVGFVTYAWNGHQSGHTMYVYKGAQSAPTSLELVRSLLAYAVVAHWACIGQRAGSQPDAWTYVPSLANRPGPHPVGQLARPIMGTVPYIPVNAAGTVHDPRSFRPENFVVGATPPRHVFVLEDSWVTVGRTQSVAGAPKRAGSEQVTALVVARFLTPGFAHTNEFMTTLTEPFDPTICPYYGERC